MGRGSGLEELDAGTPSGRIWYLQIAAAVCAVSSSPGGSLPSNTLQPARLGPSPAFDV